jgi:hypothetical protein
MGAVQMFLKMLNINTACWRRTHADDESNDDGVHHHHTERKMHPRFYTMGVLKYASTFIWRRTVPTA